MANFNDLIEEIDAKIIPHNNARLITGEKLNTTLKDMVEDINDKKQDTLTDAQLEALDSGITAEKVAELDLVDTKIGAERTRAINAEQGLDSKMNKVVLNGMTVTEDGSTVKLSLSKINIRTGDTTSQEISLPVADASSAGVMNPQTYQTIESNQNLINALIGASVAITGMPESPTQSQITTAFLSASGLTSLVNGARIFDVTNQKVWTYYTNDTTWHPVSASGGGSVVISQWTNTALGTVKGTADNAGHTNDGKITAESDGTGSVLGWDRLKDEVAGKQDEIADLESIREGAELGETALQPSALNSYRTASAQDVIDNGKVDKISGKGLSANDYTNADKAKVASAIQPGDIATTTKLGLVKPDGVSMTVDNDGTIHAVGGEPGSTDHRVLTNRDAANQHPISAITGLQDSLDAKQDAISDIDDIREGAALGATALQSVPDTYRTAANQDTIDNAIKGRLTTIEGKEAGWDAKADVEDIPTTLAELSGDATHRLVTDAEKTTWNAKQAAISDLATIRSGAALGATAYQKPSNGIPKTDLASSVQSSLSKADSALQEHQDISNLATKAEVNAKYTKPSSGIPASDIAAGVIPDISGLATQSALNSEINRAKGAEQALSGRVTTIEGKIPSEASSTNQLADKEFVNSSITSNTAFFRGTWDLVNDLGLTKDATGAQIAAALATVIDDVTNNDYSFVFYTNPTTEIAEYYDRYKYSTEDGWGFEYRLNNSSFTAAQWATINSGLTSSDKTALDNALALIATFGDIVTHDAEEFATAAQGAKADSAVQPSAISDMATKTWVEGKGYVDSSYHDSTKYDASNPSGFQTASQVSTTVNNHHDSTKQDVISDLATIRSNAALGATALQAVPDTYRTASAQDVIDDAIRGRLTTIEGKESGWDAKLSDAPSDNKQYGRKNGAWIEVTGGTSDFNSLSNRPKYNGTVMDSNTNIPQVKTQDWDAKYSKPTNGVPKTDLASSVQTSLGKADTAVQPSDISDMASKTWVGQQGFLTQHQSLALEVSSLTSNPSSISLNSTAKRTYQTCTLSSRTSVTLSSGNSNAGYVHYILFYNSGSSDCVITKSSNMLGPEEITVPAGKRLELSWIYNGSNVVLTASEPLG